MRKLTKMDLKTKAFAKEYIKNNFNGTKTALKFASKGNKMTKQTASVIAAQNLSKLSYQKPIIEEMEKISLNNNLINKITKRNIKQKSSISASNQAIDMFHKVKGNYAPERKESINIHLKGADLDARIRDKIAELKQLQDEN